jgi:hypothetical protein
VVAGSVGAAYGSAVSVVRGEARRRWSVVAACVLVLGTAPVAVRAWPSGAPAQIDPATLRERILASADQPHSGYVDTSGRLGLPPLPELAEVGGLLGGGSRIRVWHASATAWRVAELAATGERDTYRTLTGTYRWDFERNLVTYVAGTQSVWLPGAADVVPPELARRLLAGGGTWSTLPSRRVAGVMAVGLRITPTDPDTTVGRVDIWADPATGLAVQVEIAGRGGADPVFASRFVQLRQAVPDPAVLTPAIPASAGFASATAEEVTGTLAAALVGQLPASLAGRARAATGGLAGLSGVGTYGSGFGTIVVLTLPGRLGGRTLGAARDAGGTPVAFAGAQGYELRASLLTSLVVRTDGDRASRRGWLLAGPVNSGVLWRAASDLIGTG